MRVLTFFECGKRVPVRHSAAHVIVRNHTQFIAGIGQQACNVEAPPHPEKLDFHRADDTGHSDWLQRLRTAGSYVELIATVMRMKVWDRFEDLGVAQQFFRF